MSASEFSYIRSGHPAAIIQQRDLVAQRTRRKIDDMALSIVASRAGNIGY